MNKLESLIKQVASLVKADPNPYNETSLEDWITEGYNLGGTDGRTPEEIAREWDEVNGQES